MMTKEELIQRVLDAIPGAVVDMDNEGQYIVYTGYWAYPGDELTRTNPYRDA